MTEQTFNRRLNQLIVELENHNHRDELIQLMEEQLLDDTGASVPGTMEITN